jgi:hypothetical protein
MCGYIQVDAAEDEVIDFDRTYVVSDGPSRPEQRFSLWTLNGMTDLGSENK